MLRVPSAFTIAVLCAQLAALAACKRAPHQQLGSAEVYSAVPAGDHAVADATASPADDGNWIMPGKDYAATRFSGLTQVTPANVSKLALSFTFSTATTHGYEAPPLVVNNTMYLITPFPNELYALDLTKAGAPTKWVFKP
ncbi:MAG: hypothetical protein ACTHKE_03735, partial [Sphingomicrobium sp.]